MSDVNPKPGSAEARLAGCKCPVIDNYYGRGRFGDGEQFGWFMSGDCPLHGKAESDAEASHA